MVAPFRRRSLLPTALLVLTATLPLAAQDAPPPIRLAVDATGVPRKILHCQETLPAAPGPLTLVYPKWLPGDHSPSGPLNNLVNLHLSAGGRPLPWQRDPVEMYTIRCEVPAGMFNVEATFDYVFEAAKTKLATPQLVALNWNVALLYPLGKPTDEIPIQATLKLPPRWKFGTALPVESSVAGTINFQAVSLTTLVDSPVVAGAFARTIPLTEPGKNPANEINLIADSAAALEIPDDEIAHYKQLVTEALALFGATHYNTYHFLVCLSDNIGHNGLEHHESSVNTLPERAWVDGGPRGLSSDLLPHEFVHSWNGKYRRPASLTTPDFQVPMQDDGLWVYEGLTEYLGSLVLTARSGLAAPDWSHEALASTAASMDHRAGRLWRPLQDTATAASILYDGSSDWSNLRRGVDFYPEGTLLWLEVDTLIRQTSGGAKSLDDFCRVFHGGKGGPPKVVPYTFDDVVKGLNDITPYDWAKFLRGRLDETAPHAPFSGIENGGWRLVYTDTPNRIDAEKEDEDKTVDLRYSLGLMLTEDGVVKDVLGNGPAFAAGLAPGMKLVAVNSRAWTTKLLKAAVAATAKPEGSNVTLLMQNDEFFHAYRLSWRGGERYPHLERDQAKPDVLGEILKPRVPAPPTP